MDCSKWMVLDTSGYFLPRSDGSFEVSSAQMRDEKKMTSPPHRRQHRRGFAFVANFLVWGKYLDPRLVKPGGC